MLEGGRRITRQIERTSDAAAHGHWLVKEKALAKIETRQGQSRRFTAASEAFKHPLVLLLVGTLLGSLIIPYLREREARNREIENLRLQKALVAFSANQAVDADLNGLLTGFENLFKARVQTLDSERDHELQRQIYDHHNAFNRDAWWWFSQHITEAQIFGLLDSKSIGDARRLARQYDGSLRATTKALEKFWFLMESEPVLSPPGELEELIHTAREANTNGRRERLKVVSAFAALLLRRPPGESLLGEDALKDVPSNSGPKAGS